MSQTHMPNMRTQSYKFINVFIEVFVSSSAFWSGQQKYHILDQNVMYSIC